MDKRFVQAHKEARWALWLTLLYLAAWLAAAYLPGVAIGFTGLPHWFEMACLLVPLLFILLCRIAGIPARWESGFAVAPGDAGCHDWARFYVAPKGWMYADCSYGASMARRGDEVLRRHYFGSLDTGRMVANSAFEAPFDPPMLGFRSDPYDNQSGEMEADGVGLYGDDTVTTKEVLKFEEVE